MPTKPSQRPTWATDANFSSGPQIGQPTKTDPAGNAAQGFVPGEAFHSGFANFVVGSICDEWLAWLDHSASQANVYGCLQTASTQTYAGSSTLTRDVLYSEIVVSGSLNTSGYIIRARESITVSGTISVTAGATGTLPSGGAGGAGGTAGNDGAASATGSSAIYLGGFGGSGGNSVSATGGASIGVTLSGDLGASLDAWITCSARAFAGTSFRYGGAGGGGGAGGTGAGATGGAGGGIIVLVSPSITLESTATISAIGAAGSNAGGGSGAGGGGGGGGGAVILVCEELDNQGATFVLAGGAGGSGNGTGATGAAGGAGRRWWIRPSTQAVAQIF